MSARGQLRRKRILHEPVSACAISPDGQKVAYVGGRGHDVFVEQLDAPQAALQIAGGRQVTAVAIAGGKTEYRIVYSTLPAPSGAAKSRVFDPEKLEVSPWAAPVPQAAATCGSWQAVLDRKKQPGLGLCRRGLRRDPGNRPRTAGNHPQFLLDSRRPRFPAGHCHRNEHPVWRVRVRLARSEALSIAAILSRASGSGQRLAVSASGRILLSGSRDGTVRCWPLTNLQDPVALRRRWGAELSEQNGKVVVAAIDEYGPLYQKQVHAGDILTKILWLDGQAVRWQEQPKQVLERLAQLPWYAQVSFCTSRQGTARPPFNLVGGWHELLGLYTTERDWIAWTPAGYYACSAGGERLIGWQVNDDDLRRSPSFFSADKFSKVLYRPDLIRSLLKDGSMKTAMLRQHEMPTHVNEIYPPVVKIVSAEQRRVDDRQNRIRIAARAESKDDRPLVAMQLLLDGRPYGDSRTYAASDVPGRLRKETWFIELPPGQHLITVQAESERSSAADEIEVNSAGEDEIKPALYCLSIGVSDYPGKLRLHYGCSDAKALAAILEKNSAEIFSKVETKTLVDAEATQEGVEAGLKWLREKATWRDVSVLFYAGHGLNDESGRFFLLPIDGSPKNPTRTCIGDTLIKDFCQHTPGKVIVLLDACRSASVKINVNELALKLGRSDCGAIVITSSTGYQDSLEGEPWKAGAFTRALVDGLEGRADFLRTGYVSSPYDIACYVDHVVRTLTDERQTPTCAAPKMPQFKITRATVH